MEKKLGVYICGGCSIGEGLDLEKLSLVATKEYKVPICKTHPALCGEEGVSLINQDIETEGVNTIVIAACSGRVKYDVFDFGPSNIVERVNVREQVVWSHDWTKQVQVKTKDAEGKEEVKAETKPNEDTQMLGEDYIRMGIVKANKTSLPEPFLEEFTKNILVIGGGITGLTAAIEAANTGYDVTIVEKNSQLGGYAARQRKQIPTKAPYSELEPANIQEKIKEISNHPRITIKTGTEIARISGAPGMFDVSFKQAGTKTKWDVPPPRKKEEETGEAKTEEPVELPADQIKCEDILTKDTDAERFGVVVVAAGGRPADPSEFEHLGYGKFANVITNVMMEDAAAKGKIIRPSDGKEARTVAFIQSPGLNGDDSDFPYCSSVTSMISLKQAKYVREDYTDGKAFIFYKHMRTPGVYENFYKSMQNDEGIFLTRGEVKGVTENADKSLTVEVDDTMIGENIAVNVDMVVLATGMVPETRFDPVINLAYRQGPAFKDLELFDGYCDSNYICFPYETRRTGVYTAGNVRQTMTNGECIEDATGAALKAIQCLESTNRGMAVHPRSGDTSFPEFFFQRCTQCKRCTEECPFGALDDDEKGTPKPNPTRCRRCGTCMGACPERIISFKNYHVDMIGSMVKAINVPDEDEEKYRIVAFVCENDAGPALDMAGLNKLKFSADIRFIPVRCLGSVNTIWIADAMSKGMDGVLLIGCKYGDDYQCHFVKGSELCNKRMDNVAETLGKLRLEPVRVQQVQFSIDEYNKIPEVIDKFVKVIEGVGFNPMKGF
ncbi:MAG: heterodisulfide reductase subunit A [Nitrospira bacterium HGW-Nitrospira-1]|nr:MAG: heterodisulfide reductase subunit A [Nitrospira bacterium HGW-Nitrospira-1]